MEWITYDPNWLIPLAQKQLPEETWLPDALGNALVAC
jgi:hypothetical protein